MDVRGKTKSKTGKVDELSERKYGESWSWVGRRCRSSDVEKILALWWLRQRGG